MTALKNLPIGKRIKISGEGWVVMKTKGCEGFTDELERYWRWEQVDHKLTLSENSNGESKDDATD